MYERGTELDQLAELFAACAAGSGGKVVISGAAGSGKTALLQTFAERVSRGGGLVLAASDFLCDTVPLGVITEVFLGGLLPLEPEKRVLELVAEGGLCPREGESAEGLATRAMRGLWPILRDLTQDSPVLLTIDDVHRADEASLFCLLYLLRRVRQMPIMVVVAESGHFRRANPLFQAELLRDPHCHRIYLERLSPAAVDELAAGQLDSAELYASTGGNPLLLHALLADAQAAGRSARGTGLRVVAGDAFRQAVIACLSKVEPIMLLAANGVALLGDADRASLARVLNVDSAELDRALQGLEDLGLLHAGRFRHEEIDAAVLDNMAAEDQQVLRQRIAQLLQDTGAAALEVAPHLLAAGQLEEWAQPVLLEAAAQAHLGDDIDFAVQCLELATTADLTESERAAIRMMQVRVQWRTNPASAGRYLPSLGNALLAGRLSAADAFTLVRAMLWHGNLGGASEALTYLSYAARHCDREATAQLRVTQQWLRSFFPTMVDHLPATVADSYSAATFTQHVQAATLLANVLRGGPDAVAATQAAQMLQSAYLDDEMIDSIEAALLALVFSEQAERAERWCDPLMQQACDRRAQTWQARLAAVRAEIALRQGEMGDAEQWARVALTHLPPRSWGVAVGGPLATAILAATEQGKLDVAAHYLRLAVPAGMNESLYGLFYLHARARYRLATGRVHDALADFISCGEQMGQWGFTSSSLLPWRTGAALAYERVGATTHARQLIGLIREPADGRDTFYAPEDGFTRQLAELTCDHGAPVDELGPAREGAASLSDAERRVAELAALGHTNREVARALFITISTVEQHLTRIYRKLNLNGRSDLSNYLQLDSAGTVPRQREGSD